MLAVRDDCGDLTAFRRDLVLRFGQSARVYAAIGAPMAAMERHRHRALLQQRIEANQLTFVVRQDEFRHLVAGFRRIFSNAVLLQPLNQTVNGVLELRAMASHRIGEGLQPLGQRGVHVTALDKGLI
jgi:hypothetical protein